MRMHRRARIEYLIAGALMLVASTVTTAALAASTPPTAGAFAATDPLPPAAPYTGLVLDGRGTALLDGTVALTAFGTGYAYHSGERIGLVTDRRSEDQAYRVEVAPPIGQVWQVGATYAVSAAPPTASTGQFTAARGSRVCGSGVGTVTVRDLRRESAGLDMFGASFSVGCQFAPASLSGEIRWQSSADYVAAISDVKRLSFGHQAVGGPGRTQTVTVSSQGSTPLELGTAAVTGLAPGAFQIVDDTCSGVTLAYGDSCTVSVTATATVTGAQTASLSIPDNTAAGDLQVNLDVNASTDSMANRGTFYPLQPTRIFDSRIMFGTLQPIGPDRTVEVEILGRGGVPAVGVSAVVLNVTVTGGTADSFLTVYPSGTSRPLASSLNPVTGWTGANSVTVGVGAGGRVSIYNHSGTTSLIVDVSGFYATDDSMVAELGVGGGYRPLVPKRLYDSRTTGARIPAQNSAWIPIPADPAIPGGIRAVVVNVTAVDAASGGYLTAWNGSLVPGPDGDVHPPFASTLNYTTGETVPNLAVIPVDYYVGSPRMAVFTSTDAHIIVDLVGVFDYQRLADGLRFTPRTPVRIADSRGGLGLPTALGPATTAAVTVPTTVVPTGTGGLALNVTAVTASAATFITVWPAGVARPTVSNLNPARGRTVPNAAYTLLGPGNGFQVYNNAGRVDVVIDVVGSFSPPL